MTNPSAPAGDPAFLFSSFRGKGEDGLHLAWSVDGLTWTALNGGRAVLAPRVGHRPLMRDPFIYQGPDGMFHLLWTVGWSECCVGYANSRDLIHWSEQRALPVMVAEPGARNCWAPEMAWDAARGRFLIFWSSTIPGRFPETDESGDSGYNHRIYATTTEDFEALSPATLFFDPGFNVIDAAIVPAWGRFHLIVKDETRHPLRKNLLVATSDGIEGPYTNLSPAFTKSWVEGPSALRLEDSHVVYFDCYTKRRYGAMCTRDFVAWEDISDRVSFPMGTRHGAAFSVMPGMLDMLRAHYDP